MRRTLAFLLTLLATSVTTPAALGAESSGVTAVEIPVGLGSAAGARAKRERFTLVGIHWRGTGSVSFRTRSLAGRWTSWRPAAPEDEDRPDTGTVEARRHARWHVGSPWWVGPSDRIETRTSGAVTRVRAYLVWSPPAAIPLRRLSSAGRPAIVPRLSWGADESIRRAPPTYAPAVRFAIVHHTAGRTSYSRDDAAAMVKAIQLYHVKSNGWNDIGYNFLVDRFGTIYEGRYGGIDRDVVGAHALGFNTGSVGVAVLGTYGDAVPTEAAQDAVAKLLAWRLDLAHVDPLSKLTVTSGGSEKFAPGAPVLLRAVSGHRDTGSTACPGDALYARLAALAAAVSAIGQPKIYEPTVARAGGLVRFRARVSKALPWSVSVADGDGTVVASGTGTGPSIDWTWDPRTLPVARYQWTVSAGAARPATGSLRAGGATVALAIEDAVASPAGVSPNGDGQADVSLVTFRLSVPALVTIDVVDSAGSVVATVLADAALPAGAQSATIDATTLPDGGYTVVVRARASNGAQVETVVPLVVSRVLGLVSAAPAVISPNGDGRNDVFTIGFDLIAPAQVTVRVTREGRWVATPFAASLEAGPQSVTWDGTRSDGRLRDGSYDAVVEAETESGAISFSAPFAVDTIAPHVRIVSLQPLEIRVSEAAVLTVRVNGAVRRREVRRPAAVRIPWPGVVRKVRVVALDAAGNASVPVVARAKEGSRKRGQ
jgi:flagellar hook assembly protein FlgD